MHQAFGEAVGQKRLSRESNYEPPWPAAFSSQENRSQTEILQAYK